MQIKCSICGKEEEMSDEELDVLYFGNESIRKHQLDETRHKIVCSKCRHNASPIRMVKVTDWYLFEFPL